MKSPDNEGSSSGERALLDHIRRRLPTPPPSVIVPVGDDAAVVAPERGAFQVMTTDAIVESVHFDRRYSSLADIGHKAIAVNLSDLAAMGATPHVALLSLILPDGFSGGDLDLLLDGVLGISQEAGLSIVGGNISRSPGPLIVDVTVIGSVRPRRILTRSGGRPGDALYVTGTIGEAAAGLGWLKANTGRDASADPQDPLLLACVARHRRPVPRTRLGALLGRNRAATACMDLSDGLADAVRQVAEASGLGALVDASLLPIPPAVRSWFERHSQDPVVAALSGGDDFELLFSVPAKFRGRLRGVVQGSRGVEVTKIGALTAEGGVRLLRNGAEEPLPDGYTHL